MTIGEIQAAWQRYMHRNDLAQDLDDTQTFAEQNIATSLMTYEYDLADILANWPALYLHGGLMQLMEIAQDDQGLQREVGLFDRAIGNYIMRQSLDAGPKKMVRV